MSKPAIVVDHVSILFNLNKEKVDNLKEYIIKGLYDKGYAKKTVSGVELEFTAQNTAWIEESVNLVTEIFDLNEIPLANLLSYLINKS